MRPVQLTDIEVAARVLLACAPARRSCAMRTLIAHADIADRYRKRLGKRHPRYGSGSLMSAAAGFVKLSRPAHINAEALSVLEIVIGELAAKRCDQFS